MSEQKQYTRSWQMEMAEQVLLFFVPSVAVAFICAIFAGDYSYSWQAVIVWLFSLWLLFLRSKVKNFFLFIIGNAMTFLILLLVPEAKGEVAAHLPSHLFQFIYGVCTAGMVLYSIIRRYSDREVPGGGSVTGLIVSLLIFFALYVMAGSAEIPMFRQHLILASMAYIVGYFAYMHASKVDETLFYINREMMDQPIGTVKKNNTIMFVICLAALTLFMELSMLIPVGDAVEGGVIAMYLVKFFTWFVKVFDISKLMEYEGSDTGFGSEDGGFTDENESSLGGGEQGILGQFWYVMQDVALVAIVLLIIYVIIRALIRFYRTFYVKKAQKFRMAEDHEEKQEIREFIPVKKRQAKRREPVFNLTNEQKVRRMFRKKVRRYMGVKVQRGDTAEEIRRKLPQEKLETMIPLYNRARYSDRKITDEEMKNVDLKRGE